MTKVIMYLFCGKKVVLQIKFRLFACCSEFIIDRLWCFAKADLIYAGLLEHNEKVTQHQTTVFFRVGWRQFIAHHQIRELKDHVKTKHKLKKSI